MIFGAFAQITVSEGGKYGEKPPYSGKNGKTALLTLFEDLYTLVVHKDKCLLRPVVRTPGFHPGNRGSTPLGDGVKQKNHGFFVSLGSFASRNSMQ